jgi:hypothetical protein
MRKQTAYIKVDGPFPSHFGGQVAGFFVLRRNIPVQDMPLPTDLGKFKLKVTRFQTLESCRLQTKSAKSDENKG